MNPTLLLKVGGRRQWMVTLTCSLTEASRLVVVVELESWGRSGPPCPSLTTTAPSPSLLPSSISTSGSKVPSWKLRIHQKEPSSESLRSQGHLPDRFQKWCTRVHVATTGNSAGACGCCMQCMDTCTCAHAGHPSVTFASSKTRSRSRLTGPDRNRTCGTHRPDVAVKSRPQLAPHASILLLLFPRARPWQLLQWARARNANVLELQVFYFLPFFLIDSYTKRARALQPPPPPTRRRRRSSAWRHHAAMDYFPR